MLRLVRQYIRYSGIRYSGRCVYRNRGGVCPSSQHRRDGVTANRVPACHRRYHRRGTSEVVHRYSRDRVYSVRMWLITAIQRRLSRCLPLRHLGRDTFRAGGGCLRRCRAGRNCVRARCGGTRRFRALLLRCNVAHRGLRGLLSLRR